MKSSSELKKIILGIGVSDAHIETRGRLDMYSKHPEYINYLHNTLSHLTHTEFKKHTKRDKRGYVGYRLFSTTSKYLQKFRKILYPNGEKELTPYVVNRLDKESFAHIWMCDGYLEHNKNRKSDKCQNIGYLCLEAFPLDQLELIVEKLKEFGIESSYKKVPWGFGYRIRIGGENLQKFISMVYPHILPCFKYKTELFYKRKDQCLDLPSAEQYIIEYNSIEDIVRYLEKSKKT